MTKLTPTQPPSGQRPAPPLIEHIEPYRQRLFTLFFDTFDEHGRLRYNLGLDGRAKKNWKTVDADLKALYALCSDPLRGYDNDISTLANDLDQARDDLDLGKKLVRCNPVLDDWLVIKKDRIERRGGAQSGHLAGSRNLRAQTPK